ncbi:hypothetical protein D3C85_1192010 [compost metagenome]
MRGRLAYCCCSLESSASRLAISLESCELSKSGVATLGFSTGLSSCLRWVSTFCGLGAWVTTAALGFCGCTSGAGLGAGGGVTLLIWLSWNGATSVVLGRAFFSRVPLPCWFSWARKSAFFGATSLLKVARVISRVLLICVGGFRVKLTPRINARCSSAARNRVNPSRSAGRTPAREYSGGRSAESVIEYSAAMQRGKTGSAHVPGKKGEHHSALRDRSRY